jgi:Zn-dependent M28 family amino/carboxypeptidase
MEGFEGEGLLFSYNYRLKYLLKLTKCDEFMKSEVVVEMDMLLLNDLRSSQLGWNGRSQFMKSEVFG